MTGYLHRQIDLNNQDDRRLKSTYLYCYASTVCLLFFQWLFNMKLTMICRSRGSAILLSHVVQFH